MGEMLKKKTFYSWNQNCASAEARVLLANLKTKGAPLAVKLEQFCSGWYSRAGIFQLWPVRSLGPPHHFTEGRKDIEACRRPWKCRICQGGDHCHPTVCCGSVLPPELTQAPELGQQLKAASLQNCRGTWNKEQFHSLWGCEQPAKRKVFCLFPRSKPVCRKILVGPTLANHNHHLSFPRILLPFLITRSFKVSKCFMEKQNLRFFIRQPVTPYNDNLICIVTSWNTQWKISESLRIVNFRYKGSSIPW